MVRGRQWVEKLDMWNSHKILAGMKSCVATLGKFSSSSKLQTLGLPCDPEIPLRGVYPGAMKMCIHTKICAQRFLTGLFMLAKRYKQSKCTSGRMDKQNVV